MKKIIFWIFGVLVTVFLITPLSLANEKVIENLHWFNWLTTMLELIYRFLPFSLSMTLAFGLFFMVCYSFVKYYTKILQDKNFDTKFNEAKNALKDYSDNLFNAQDLTHDLSRDIIHRKINFLHKCFKDNKLYTAPTTWVSERESKLFNKLKDSIIENDMELLKKLNGGGFNNV